MSKSRYKMKLMNKRTCVLIIDHWHKLGKALDKNADEIDQLYHSLETTLELEKISSSWQFLVEHGFILGNLHSGYSPSSLLLQLGDILSLAANRQTQAPDVSEWLENMRRLIKRYQLAKSENDETDQINIKREMYSNVLFMQTTLEGEVSQLEYYIDNKFGHVNSLKAKQQENEYCIERASRSAEKLTIINETEISLLCGNDGELLQIFLHKLLPTVKNCRDRLLATIPRLKKILWEYRRIDQRTHLVQVMHNYLQNGRSFSADTLSDKQMLISPFNKVKPLSISGFADVQDASQRSNLITIVKSMRPNKYAEHIADKEEPIENSLIQKADHQKIELPPPLLQPYLIQFIQAVKKEKQSARSFWQQQKSNHVVPTGIWLWWLHLQLQQAKNPKLFLSPCFAVTPEISANRVITDIIVDLVDRKNEHFR